MDGTLVLLIPVLALATGLVAVMRMPKKALGGGTDKADEDERLEALESEVSRLRTELGEAQERLDFTERALIRVEEQRRLEAGRREQAPPA